MTQEERCKEKLNHVNDRPLVYLAADYSANEHSTVAENCYRAWRIADEIQRDGRLWIVVPHNVGIGMESSLSPDEWYHYTLALMLKCDGVLVMHGHNNGPYDEEYIAERTGMPTKLFHTPEFAIIASRILADKIEERANPQRESERLRRAPNAENTTDEDPGIDRLVEKTSELIAALQLARSERRLIMALCENDEIARTKPLHFNQRGEAAILAGTKRQTRRILKSQPPHETARGLRVGVDTRSGRGCGMTVFEEPFGAWSATCDWGIEFPYATPGNILWQAGKHVVVCKSVRVERLQDITEEDARAEGALATPTMSAVEVFKEIWAEIYGPDSWHENPFVWVIDFDVVETAKENQQ